MDALDTMRQMLERKNISNIKASAAMGKSRSYISALFSQKSVPSTKTLAEFCEATGYELIARDREDGFEFTITP